MLTWFNFSREEIRESAAVAKEIGEVISMGNNAFDTEDLDAELDNMAQEALDNQMLSAPAAPISQVGDSGKTFYSLFSTIHSG